MSPSQPSAPESAETYPVALYLQDAHPIREAIGFAQYAEQRGFDAVWQAESRLVREATVPMAAFAASTDHIKIASGVVDCWSRNPARLAATFSTLDDLAPGRIILGIGAWWDPLAQKIGIDRAKRVVSAPSSTTSRRGRCRCCLMSRRGQRRRWCRGNARCCAPVRR